MLEEAKSLFEYAEDNFGTNNSTGFPVTMSWQGNQDVPGTNQQIKNGIATKEYLLDLFGRLRNTYTKSQHSKYFKTSRKNENGSSESQNCNPNLW